MSDTVDNGLRIGILACIGGFAAGIATKTTVDKLTVDNMTHDKKGRKKSAKAKEYGELCFNDCNLIQKDITTFSDITALVGSVSDNQEAGPTDSQVIDESARDYFEIMRNYPNTSGNLTLMAKYLTAEIYESYWNMETSLGFSFDNMIQPGLDVPHFQNCGFVAGDEYTFDTFSNFIDPIMTEKHNGFRRGVNKHTKCLDPTKLSGNCSLLDPNYVESVSFTVGRSISGYRFLPACNRAERREIEEKLRNVFQNISTIYGINFRGEYFSNDGKNQELLQALPHDSPRHWLDKPHTDVYVSAGTTRDWPDARGIFVCTNQGIYASVNRDDHLRIFCKADHSDVARAFKKFCLLHEEIETKMEYEGLKFAYHTDYGYLLWYPSVIGTGLKVCMRIRLRHLSQSGKLFEVMKRLRLRFNFSSEQEKAQNGWMEIYNGDRLGFSEVELTELVVAGAQKLIELEKQLEKSRSIDRLIPLPRKASFESCYEG